MVEAATKACAHEFIAKFTDGKHTLSTYHIKMLYQYILPTYRINIPYLHILSKYPINTRPHNRFNPDSLATPILSTRSQHPLSPQATTPEWGNEEYASVGGRSSVSPSPESSYANPRYDDIMNG